MKLLIRTLFLIVMIYATLYSQSAQNNLITYYPFNGNANDESGNNLNGTIFGATLSENRNGISNGAYKFDGEDDYIFLGDKEELKIYGDLTISFWMNTNSFEEYSQGIIACQANNSDNPNTNAIYNLYINNSRMLHYVHESGMGVNHEHDFTNYLFNKNIWYHVALTRDTAQKKISIFVDGDLVDTYEYEFNPDNGYLSTIRIGENHGTIKEKRFFNGKLDDILIYDRALLTHEIQYLYSINSNFTANTLTGLVPLTIQFSDQFTNIDSTYKINSWQWDFDNDGLIDSEEQNPEWTYYQNGIYSVKLTVSDSINNSKVLLKKNYISALSESPFITSVVDVPNDQGRLVEVRFAKSFYDTDSLILPKSMSPELYTIEAKYDENWIAVASTVGYGKLQYLVLVPTTKDSTSESDGLISFRIVAGMNEGNFVSDIEIGYSVDNLKPSIPKGLTANITGNNSIELLWDDILDNDLNYYNVYRNTENYFEKNLQPIGQVVESDFLDNQADSGITYYYSIKSVDFSENESEYSETFSIIITSVLNDQFEYPTSFSLNPSFPNPFNPTTIITYSIPKISDVLIKVYDLLGNEVTTLVDDRKNIGKYKIVFDGSYFSSGIYFYRMQAGNYFQSRKFILLK